MAISMLKIRRPLGRLIFNMGIAIPGKTVFLIETAPRGQWVSDEWWFIELLRKTFKKKYEENFLLENVFQCPFLNVCQYIQV